MNSNKSSASTTPPPPAAVPPLFRRLDWWTMGITFIIIWVIYYLTLAPQVTLEDSGELTTASYWAGIPHPPGYPFWTIYTWLWTVLVPFGNIAWRVSLAEASTAAMACGVLAFMVSRGSSMLMEGIEELKGMTGKWEQGICVVSGVTAGLLMGLGTNLWKESVAVNRISPFGVPWLMLLLLCMMRWIYAPHQRRYLYLAMFFFGICTTIHQTLMLAALGIEIGITMADVELGRDLYFFNSVVWIGGLIGESANMLPQMESASPMIRAIFNAVGFCSVAACIWLTIKTARLMTRWKTAILMGVFIVVGASFYFYEPLAGMTNPPMEWGYPRTVAGFAEALSRGQYNKVDPTDVLKDPHRFFIELKMLVNGVADAFNWVYMFFALLPLLFIFKMQKRERAWIVLVAGIYPFLGVLLSICLSPTPDRQSADLVKVFFIASHTLIAIMIGYGLALTMAYMATHYETFRRWGLVGAVAVALPLAIFNLKDATGKNYVGLDGEVSWGELGHWIGQAFAKDQYGLPIFANLILIALTVAFVAGLIIYRDRAPLLITMAIFAAMPLYSGLTHWFHSEQRNHWFGYWFGHDMFTPPFIGTDNQLTYDPAQREQAAKGTNAAMVYPEMARDAVVFGGTDPGRFCPTYMIFCESFIPHRCQPEQDRHFDRRDCYLITQNALADTVYLDYIRAQFNRHAQIDPPFFQDFLPFFLPKIFHKPTTAFAFLDNIFSAIGGKIEYRRRTGTSWFEANQITNVKDLEARLRGRTDPLSKYLYGRFSKETQSLLDNTADDSTVRHALVKDLNSILEGGSIYDADRFKGATVPPLIAQAEGETNIPATIVRLNRRLLEEAYPGDFTMSLGGVYPDTEITTPTREDGSEAINQYYNDLGRRAQHDFQNPNEPKQVRPGEEVHLVNNQIQISGGQTTVMGINGLLTKVIFDKNPQHEFYVEESFPLEWMYPYLTPFSVIMKINREPVAELSQDVIDKDHAFWTGFSRRTIGSWITYDTSITNICNWAEDVYLRHDFSHFTGDRKFVRDDDGQKAFSKMRSAIGASIYLWRMHNPHSPAEHTRTAKEAEFALKQAFAYCPYSPETVFHLVTLMLENNRIGDALTVLRTCRKLDPFNEQIGGWISSLEKGEQSAGNPQQQVHDYFVKVQQAMQSGQTNVASQMLNQLLHFTGTDPATLVGVASLYLRLRDLPNAEMAFIRITEMVPNSSEAWYNLGLVEANMGKTTNAIAAVKNALKFYPEEQKVNSQIPNLPEKLFQDTGFARLRETPEFKAAFPPKT